MYKIESEQYKTYTHTHSLYTTDCYIYSSRIYTARKHLLLLSCNTLIVDSYIIQWNDAFVLLLMYWKVFLFFIIIIIISQHPPFQFNSSQAMSAQARPDQAFVILEKYRKGKKQNSSRAHTHSTQHTHTQIYAFNRHRIELKVDTEHKCQKHFETSKLSHKRNITQREKKKEIIIVSTPQHTL